MHLVSVITLSSCAATHHSANIDGLELNSYCILRDSLLTLLILLRPPAAMSLNGLTGSAGLKLGPLVLETLVKHYFERLKVAHKIPATTSSDGVALGGNQGGHALNNNLRQEELLYDQAFTIVKVGIMHFSFPETAAAFASADCVSRLIHSALAVLYDCYLLLIRVILPSYRRVAASRTSWRPLLGE